MDDFKVIKYKLTMRDKPKLYNGVSSITCKIIKITPKYLYIRGLNNINLQAIKKDKILEIKNDNGKILYSINNNLIDDCIF